MTQYSGRTSAYEHKRNDWQQADISKVSEAIRLTYILEAQWTKCPIEVEKEVKKLWKDNEYGNDYFYHTWSWDDEYTSNYPIITQYLKEQGIDSSKKILIHWWW